MANEIKATRTAPAASPHWSRHLLWILVVPLFVIEWALDALVKIVQVVHKSFETLTLVLHNTINEPARTKPNP